ncbi:MAG: hypothetical protein IJZ47_05885 [Oscillospiraceae bacterium]|nr:hypothetical protein [Oscillospiraceae bacterium]MBQ8194879.1 hypothetical protein [Oscillospiraceae bacterium]
MYIYPDNLKAAPTLFLWRLKDLAVIGVGALISIFAMVQMGFSVPLAVTLAYAFLAIRFDDTSILDFIKYAARYFFVEQQEFRWRL